MAEIERLTVSQALALLPDKETIHYFRCLDLDRLIEGFWDRKHAIRLIERAKEVRVTGPTAQSRNHKMAIEDKISWIAIETRYGEEVQGSTETGVGSIEELIARKQKELEEYGSSL